MHICNTGSYVLFDLVRTYLLGRRVEVHLFPGHTGEVDICSLSQSKPSNISVVETTSTNVTLKQKVTVGMVVPGDEMIVQE
jgi:hypothetical protein